MRTISSKLEKAVGPIGEPPVTIQIQFVSPEARSGTGRYSPSVDPAPECQRLENRSGAKLER